jgi:hypothetical protein
MKEWVTHLAKTTPMAYSLGIIILSVVKMKSKGEGGKGRG